MDRQEVDKLLTSVVAVCPSQNANSNMADIWFELFKLCPYEEAKAAFLDIAPSWKWPSMPPAAIIDRVKERRRASSSAKTVDPENHCGRPSCTCTHTAPCDHGYIETEGLPGSYSVAVVHCNNCHPDRRQRPDENRLQWQARLQGQDRAWEKRKYNES